MWGGNRGTIMNFMAIDKTYFTAGPTLKVRLSPSGSYLL